MRYVIALSKVKDIAIEAESKDDALKRLGDIWTPVTGCIDADDIELALLDEPYDGKKIVFSNTLWEKFNAIESRDECDKDITLESFLSALGALGAVRIGIDGKGLAMWDLRLDDGGLIRVSFPEVEDCHNFLITYPESEGGGSIDISGTFHHTLNDLRKMIFDSAFHMENLDEYSLSTAMK